RRRTLRSFPTRRSSDLDEPDARLRRERLLLGGRAKLRERFVVAPESRKGAAEVRARHNVPLVECDRATQERHRLLEPRRRPCGTDRKSTRLNSSHLVIS